MKAQVTVTGTVLAPHRLLSRAEPTLIHSLSWSLDEPGLEGG